MRWAIFSDIHSNLEAFDAVVKAYKEENIDTYVCLGDIVGYGVNPVECIQMARDISDVIIAGNHDWAVAGQFSTDYFNDWARRAVLWTQKRISHSDNMFLSSLKLIYEKDDLVMVHGSLESPQYFDYVTGTSKAYNNFRIMRKDICFIGHTHSPEVFSQDESGNIECMQKESFQVQEGRRYIVNVGSVGQPRDGDTRACFCIYDTEKKEILIKRVNYDIKITYMLKADNKSQL